MFSKLLKRFVCRHKHVKFVRDLLSTERRKFHVNEAYRSLWECVDCGEIVPKEDYIGTQSHFGDKQERR